MNEILDEIFELLDELEVQGYTDDDKELVILDDVKELINKFKIK